MKFGRGGAARSVSASIDFWNNLRIEDGGLLVVRLKQHLRRRLALYNCIDDVSDERLLIPPDRARSNPRDRDPATCQGRSKFGPLRRSKSRPVGEGVAVFVGRLERSLRSPFRAAQA